MSPDAPFQQDHAGFTAEFHSTREERGWSVAFLLFAPLWATLVVAGILSQGTLDGTTLCMLATVPFVAFVTWVGVDQALTRRTLRLSQNQLMIETRKLFKTVELLDIREVRAACHEHITTKGARILQLHLDVGDEQKRLSASNWKTADLEELAQMIDRLAMNADPDSPLVVPASLEALRRGLEPARGSGRPDGG